MIVAEPMALLHLAFEATNEALAFRALVKQTKWWQCRPDSTRDPYLLLLGNVDEGIQGEQLAAEESDLKGNEYAKFVASVDLRDLSRRLTVVWYSDPICEM